jgi:peroxiredoxin
MSMRVSIQQCLISLLVIGAMMPAGYRAEIDFFQTPAEQKPPITKKSGVGTRGTKIAKILFFIAPGCSACPDEAAKLESELNRMGLKYQIEGVFVGDPPQAGKYFSALGTYPFKFEIALDMDGKITKQYGVKTFPSAAVEVDGKKFVITKPTELEAKLR